MGGVNREVWSIGRCVMGGVNREVCDGRGQ